MSEFYAMWDSAPFWRTLVISFICCTAGWEISRRIRRGPA